MTIYTPEEKIDYIFKELKAQKRSRIMKLFLKIALLFLLIFLYITYIHGIDKNKLINNFSGILLKIVKPITKDLINNVMENSTNSDYTSKSLILEELKKNPNLINNLK